MTAHLQHNFSLLLDLAYYVSSANYTQVTRPAFSSLLIFPTNYQIPPGRRTQASLRTDHLGILSGDLDFDNAANRSLLPERLRTVPRVDGQKLSEQKTCPARFALEAIIEAACEPVEKLIQIRASADDFAYSKKATSLDCLLYGYLSLATLKLPQNFLQETLLRRYPHICAYSRSLQSRLSIPHYSPAPARPLLEQSSLICSNLISSIFPSWMPPSDERADRVPIFAGMSLAAGIGLLSWTSGSSLSISTWLQDTLSSRRQDMGVMSQGRRLDDMGEVGLMLSGLDFGG